MVQLLVDDGCPRCATASDLMPAALWSAKTDFALAGAGVDGLGIDDHVCTLAFTTEYSVRSRRMQSFRDTHRVGTELPEEVHRIRREVNIR